MSDYGRISKAIVKAIADALRFCNGNEAQYTPGQMPNAVRLLKKRLMQKTITQNGTYIPPSNYDGFDRVTVNVEGSSGDAVLVSKNIIANGNYSPVDDNADGYSSVSVAVPGPNLQSKTATANGTVTPDSGYDGLSSVEVAVPNTYSAADNGKVVSNGQLVAQTARAAAITQNGTYDTTVNNSVTINVSGGGSGGAVVQPLSVTQNGTYNPPSGVDGYAPVTVNVSGGGSEYIEEWDLSQSLTGELHGISISAYNTVVSSAGVVFDSTTDYLLIPMSWNGITIEVDVATMNLASGSHRRFIMSNSECGLIYRSTGVWGFYSSSGWAQDSGETDGSFFDGSTIKITVDYNGYWHIYKDGVLWWEPDRAQAMSGSNRQIRIGSDNFSINNAIITGFRLS